MTTINEQTGLVLEGGGMRGVFTGGVLDYLLDQKIYFQYIVAVSAGTCNGLSYMSRQRGRAKMACIDMLERFQFIGLKYLWTQHSILDLETIYHIVPEEYLPYDYDACFSNTAVMEMVTTNCLTGQSCYLTEKKDKKRLVDLAQASSSLPFVCPIVTLDGQPMLDGGIIDSIPICRAMDTGHAFNVVVLTRNKGYRIKMKDYKVPAFVYKEYPRLRVRLSRMNAYYNKQLDLVERLEEEGKILVIRPLAPLTVGRLERNIEKLTELYHHGYECAQKALRDCKISILS